MSRLTAFRVRHSSARISWELFWVDNSLNSIKRVERSIVPVSTHPLRDSLFLAGRQKTFDLRVFMLHHSAFPCPQNLQSSLFLFYSVNLAHIPFRLGRQEGVLIHHLISCSHHLYLFVRAVDLHGQTPARTDTCTDRPLHGRTQESQPIVACRSSGVPRRTTVE